MSYHYPYTIPTITMICYSFLVRSLLGSFIVCYINKGRAALGVQYCCIIVLHYASFDVYYCMVLWGVYVIVCGALGYTCSNNLRYAVLLLYCRYELGQAQGRRQYNTIRGLHHVIIHYHRCVIHSMVALSYSA